MRSRCNSSITNKIARIRLAKPFPPYFVEYDDADDDDDDDDDNDDNGIDDDDVAVAAAAIAG